MNGFAGIGYIIGAIFIFALAFQSGTILTVAIIAVAIFVGLLIVCGLISNTSKAVTQNNVKSTNHTNNIETKIVKKEPKKDNQEQFMMCTTREDIMSHTERVWGIDDKDINPFNEDK